MGPFEDKMFLILIDAHSKWIEAFCTQKATSRVVIDALRPIFARFGIPETIVSDNGTPFVSEEFIHFLHQNGIKHNTSAPYHPASNGLAERAVQIVKRGLKKVISGDINSRLAKVLLTYRISPQSTTGVSPSELLVGRRLRTRLDLLKPNTAVTVEEKQLKQKRQHDARAKDQTFELGNLVFLKNFGRGRRWLRGKITKITGPVSYHVLLDDGRQRRCHQDQLRLGVIEFNPLSESDEEATSMDLSIPFSSSEEAPTSPEVAEVDPHSPEEMSDSSEAQGTGDQAHHYPQRSRVPPERYQASWT